MLWALMLQLTYQWGSVEVIIHQQGEPTRNLIVLPGWGHSADAICQTNLCHRALQEGYRLILPQMGKSLYTQHVYPQTRKDWRGFPTLQTWRDTLLPALKNQGYLALPTYVLGISTGGRGAVLLILYFPEFFVAGAALSGDFDTEGMPQDNLLRGWLGPYDQFADRWRQESPYLLAPKLNRPLFLAHGKKDAIVPAWQSEKFYSRCKSLHPNLKIQLSLDLQAGHDYPYWEKAAHQALNFFRNL
ncbi:MAG: prolyl oligopeptidase family serine peptidase [Bacteroidia bacterium]